MKEIFWLGLILILLLLGGATTWLFFAPQNFDGGELIVLEVRADEGNRGDRLVAARQAAEILRRRIRARMIYREKVRVVSDEQQNGAVFIHAKIKDSEIRAEDIIDDLLTPGVCRFRAVHAENNELVSRLLGSSLKEPNLPLGYRKVSFTSNAKGHAYTVERLMPWSRAEWLAPENQSRLKAAMAGASLGMQTDDLWDSESSLKPAFQDWLRDHVSDHIPVFNCELVLMPEKAPDGTEVFEPLFIELRERMGEDSIKGTRVEMNHGITILLFFRNKDEFCQVSGYLAPGGVESVDSQPRMLAIFLDERVLTAPSINEPICGGVAAITGAFSAEEARYISEVIDMGKLPCTLTVKSISPIEE